MNEHERIVVGDYFEVVCVQPSPARPACILEAELLFAGDQPLVFLVVTPFGAFTPPNHRLATLEDLPRHPSYRF